MLTAIWAFASAPSSHDFHQLWGSRVEQGSTDLASRKDDLKRLGIGLHLRTMPLWNVGIPCRHASSLEIYYRDAVLLDEQTIDFPTLDRFVRERRAGTIQPAGHELPKDPSNRTVGADLEFLRAAFNHALRVRRPDGSPLLTSNPMGQGKAAYQIPNNPTPRRLLVTFDRFEAIMVHADAVDPQRLFGGFMAGASGWVPMSESVRWRRSHPGREPRDW